VDSQAEAGMISCVRRGYTMEAVKVGIREFREKLASFLETGTPVAVTRHGETIGFYIPARSKPKNEDLAALQAAAAKLDAMIAAAGLTEEDLVEDFKRAGRSSRKR
jgi:antitoxin (DNA-binding transcriptional repressor) of toxin-antitoxin stability system